MTDSPRQRRVLFLIADTGAGHRSAANAIHHAMRFLAESPAYSSPRLAVPVAGAVAGAPTTATIRRPARPRDNAGWDAQIVDAFVECGRFPLRNGVFLYGPAIKHSPQLYGRVFHVSNSPRRFQAAWRIARPFMYHGIVRLLLETQPDVIVSVHPLLNHITLQVLHDLDLRIPFLTVVTDLVSIHCAWMAPGVTACIVPTEAAKRLAFAAGVPHSRVHLLGMPIDPKFAQPAPASRETLRAELGLDPHLPTALLVGGGEGAIGLERATLALARSDLNIQLVVVTGRNKQLYGRLLSARVDFKIPAHILGFVDNMPDLMHAADVIVTKAGPGTITEAMACELPIVLTGAVPGQEEGNIDYVLDNRLGVLARSPDAVVAALREILAPGSPLLRELRANVRGLSRPEASFDIARLILKHLPAPESPSAWSRLRRTAALRRYRPRPPRRINGAQPRRRFRRSGRLMLRAWDSGSAGASRRLSLRGLGRRANGQLRRLPALAHFSGARAFLLKGRHLGKVQLRRPGGSRRRHDAGPALGGSGD
jgi:1,2-diacylglycerol 3-beta-galactosyltransferase